MKEDIGRLGGQINILNIPVAYQKGINIPLKPRGLINLLVFLNFLMNFDMAQQHFFPLLYLC